jgi:acyl-CoA synthetase (AMP-forming)/AMP-acid ligase II
VVVNNAGISIRRWVSQSYDRFRDYERTMALNYLGPVRLLLGLLPSMRERGSGHIVNVATIGVDLPAMRWSAYIASKSAFETWLGGVAPEIRPDGVTVTSVHLQLVRSPMLGPFRIWNYLPGMSTDEAAGILARAIVERPRTISPLWARIGGPLTTAAQGPVESALARYAGAVQQGRRRPGLPTTVSKPAGLAAEAIGSFKTILATGLARPVRPDRLARAARAQRRYGVGPAFLAAAAAELHPDRTAIIDELGEITFSELDARARALAGALHAKTELEPGQRVAIMCRNHRGFVEAAAAAGRLGCDLVPLNSDFAGPQLADVLAREGAVAAFYDEEFEPVFEAAAFEGTRIVGWHEGDQTRLTIDSLIALGLPDAPPSPSPGRIVMLTSGTTGTPKGAHRTIGARAVVPLAAAAFLDLARIKPTPRSGEPFEVPPPLFHLYGQIGLFLAFVMGSPLVVRRRFDPEATLASIERNRTGALLAVPTMLKRIMDLPPETRSRYDHSSLRFAISGAAPLAPELALAFMDEFGDILFNGYATTEVGTGTIATPADLRNAPGTVGKPAAGVKIRILGDDGAPLPAGETGRIFVGSPLVFDGYSGGGGKEVIDGLMSSGDVGHFDAEGRLFIDGRDDDMIVSGGENVFPQEVEELLAGHEAVADAAVFGVPDPDFGQRLTALVVLRDGASAGEDELREYVRQRLARYKVPREIGFVAELPRTSTGKLQRRRLGDLHQHAGN